MAINEKLLNEFKVCESDIKLYLTSAQADLAASDVICNKLNAIASALIAIALQTERKNIMRKIDVSTPIPH